MKNKFVLLILPLIFLYSCDTSTYAQKKEKDNASHSTFVLEAYQQVMLDSLVNAAIVDSIIPGAVLSIFVENQEVYSQAYGWASSQDFGGSPLEQSEAMTTDHMFDLASLTKVFATTMAVMKLVNDKEVDLSDPIAQHLPLCEKPEWEEITVRHLLTHTSGLAPWKPLYYHASTSEETYAYICSLPLASEVGDERHYSDLGFMLLGYLVENISGMSLQNYLHENIYHPLGLKKTLFLPEDPTFKFAATSHGNPFERKMVEDPDFGYTCDENPDDFNDWRQRILIGEVNDGNAYHANEGMAGHAGLFSTADELQQLMQLLLKGGNAHQKNILDSQTIKTFLTKDIFGHGLGWAMSANTIPVSNLPEGAFGHTGFTGTYALGLPDRNASLVLLTNRQHLGVNEEGYYPSVTNLRRAVSEYFIDISQP